MKYIILMFLSMIPSVLHESTPVIKVCFVDKQKDADISVSIVEKSKADMCVWEVKDCKDAELWMYKSSFSDKRIYMSQTPGRCK